MFIAFMLNCDDKTKMLTRAVRASDGRPVGTRLAFLEPVACHDQGTGSANGAGLVHGRNAGAMMDPSTMKISASGGTSVIIALAIRVRS